jgi:hypothetical protein
MLSPPFASFALNIYPNVRLYQQKEECRLAISPYPPVQNLLKYGIDASVSVEQKKRGGCTTMFCVYCKNERVENEAPCPYCGALSPLVEDITYGQKETYRQGEQPSLLPIPYQGGGMQQADFPWYQVQETSRQMIPSQETAQVTSALSVQAEEHGAIYIPPMYIKPRAIIPRYRIISGFFSVLIVFTLLCTGASYYARASGQLSNLQRITGNILPPSLHPATPVLADPPNRVDHGPAYLIIPSASLSAHLDPQNDFFALKSDTVFKPDQTFYIIYSVQHPQTQGVVLIKWYTDGALYTSASSSINAGANVTGKAAMQYAKPAEGSVELDWNGQLAQKLYFVVRD